MKDPPFCKRLMSHDEFILFSGTTGGKLAAEVAQALGRPLGRRTLERFPDGEVNVHLDEPVRGHEVFLVQSTGPPVNENLVELLALADACRRSSARCITAVVPYFGYARSDKRHGRRAPIAASMVASVLQAVGIQHVVTVDLHAAQIEGFFHIPVDSLTAVPAMVHVLREKLPAGLAVVSPDEGRFKMATDFARRLGAPVVVLHKERKDGAATSVVKVVGDVRERPCLIIDDMISTGGTIADAVTALLREGARPEMFVAATHGVVRRRRANPAESSGHSRHLRDRLGARAGPAWPGLNIVFLAPLLAAAIRRFRSDESIGDLYAHVMHSGGAALSAPSTPN
jgi:ribose-phosphate pyrophosphokinase